MRSKLRLLLPVLPAMVLLAGCSGADSDSSTTAGQPSETSRSPVTSSGTPTTAGAEYELQGHRGARGLKPENTLPSFEAALDLMVTTLEGDLHFTADGQVVVWHDPVIDPSKCGIGPASSSGLPDPDDPEVDQDTLRVRALTAEQLAGYRCDRNPDPDRFPRQLATPGEVAGNNYGIAGLNALFEFVAAYADSPDKTAEQRTNARTVLFNLETKRVADIPSTIDDGFDGTTAGPFELAVLATAEAAGVSDRTIIQSFDHRSLWAVAATRSTVRLSALTSRSLPDFTELVERGATIWSPRDSQVSPASLGNAHKAGLSVIPWTINDTDDMQTLLDLGVDGLITDRPDLAPRRS